MGGGFAMPYAVDQAEAVLVACLNITLFITFIMKQSTLFVIHKMLINCHSFVFNTIRFIP